MEQLNTMKIMQLVTYVNNYCYCCIFNQTTGGNPNVTRCLVSPTMWLDHVTWHQGRGHEFLMGSFFFFWTKIDPKRGVMKDVVLPRNAIFPPMGRVQTPISPSLATPLLDIDIISNPMTQLWYYKVPFDLTFTIMS